jgi:histidinol phosphatase-like enzyme
VTEEILDQIHEELQRRLSAVGAGIDDIYYCPFHPNGVIEEYTKESDLRKPEPGMLLKAAAELDLDLTSSWMIGDSERDVEAGRRAGCGTVRILHRDLSPGPGQFSEETAADYTAWSLHEAAEMILEREQEVDEVIDRQDEEIEELQAEEEAGDEDLEILEEEDEEISDTEFEDDAGEERDDEEAEEEEEEIEEELPPEEQFDPEPDEEPVIVQQPPALPGAGETEEGMTDSDVRREILSCVRQMTKEPEEGDFSLLNLLGGLSQSIVFLFLLVALYQAIGPENIDWATLWAVIAMTFQVMSLTFFTIVKNQK